MNQFLFIANYQKFLIRIWRLRSYIMILSPETAMKGPVRLEQITVNDTLFLRELNTLIGQSVWAFEKGTLAIM